MKIYTKIKIFFKILFNIQPSITKVEILKKAKDFRCLGLCYAIDKALFYYGIDITDGIIHWLFPLFNRTKAINFGANTELSYWWPSGIWYTGREDFLNWLIEQYKDDKTDVRKEAKRLLHLIDDEE